MIVECCGYDQTLNVLNSVRPASSLTAPSNERLTETMLEKYTNGKVCIRYLEGTTDGFEGWCDRPYYENRGETVYSYDEIFGSPEEFGQMSLDEVLACVGDV